MRPKRSTAVRTAATSGVRDSSHPSRPNFDAEYAEAAHNVVLHDHGYKRFHHPVVGDLQLAFEAMPLPANTGLTLTAYSAEPGSPSRDALALLESWAATLDRNERGVEVHTSRPRHST
jgi:hypothetical protein